MLTPQEYAQARSTVNDAFYTSPTVIDGIYEALGNFGFDGGNVLEPAMGIGNFFGRMPEAMQKLMYVLCGGYLIYLAIKMGRDYPGLAASGVWSSDRIIAVCGAITFSILGAALLVITAVRSVREWKQDAQNEQEEHTDE